MAERKWIDFAFPQMNMEGGEISVDLNQNKQTRPKKKASSLAHLLDVTNVEVETQKTLPNPRPPKCRCVHYTSQRGPVSNRSSNTLRGNGTLAVSFLKCNFL